MAVHAGEILQARTRCLPPCDRVRAGLVNVGVTNAHVVTGQKDIKVHFSDGTHYPATIIERTKVIDLGPDTVTGTEDEHAL